jgi:enoyl-[acyl-carrier-protein] reductase (NADH)
MERAMSGINLNPRTIEANEMAEIALFLASDSSSSINGTVIVGDTGWTAY